MVAVVYFIADAVSGPLTVTPPGGDGVEEVPISAAVTFTVLGGLVGVVLALLSTRLKRSVNVFTGICLVSLVLYGIAPFGAAESTSTAIWLNVMHLAAAIPIVGMLRQWLIGVVNNAG
jgi:uncharacterized membrane protein